jgi:hypothetical protein
MLMARRSRLCHGLVKGCARGLIGSPRAEQSMSAVSRRPRVSSRLASITQKMLVRWYHGGCFRKKANA